MTSFKVKAAQRATFLPPHLRIVVILTFLVTSDPQRKKMRKRRRRREKARMTKRPARVHKAVP